MDGEDSKIANARRSGISIIFAASRRNKTKVQYTAVWSAANIAFDHVIALISANGQSNAARDRGSCVTDATNPYANER